MEGASWVTPRPAGLPQTSGRHLGKAEVSKKPDVEGGKKKEPVPLCAPLLYDLALRER